MGGKKKIMASTTGMMVCSRCHRELPETTEYFKVSNAAANGLNYRCKSCCIELDRIDRKKITTRSRLSVLSHTRQARKGRDCACKTSADAIARSYTGFCHSCGVSDKECKLENDVCRVCDRHVGWACEVCNQGWPKGMTVEKCRKLIAYREKHNMDNEHD